MQRDVPRSWMHQVHELGKRATAASLFVLIVIGASLSAFGQGIDIAIDALHISWVETADVESRTALNLDQALVGDTIRVSATVRNAGTTTAGQFNVDFFFTETISGEHGKIGSQAVIGLEPGEQRRPVVTFDSTAFAPGIYIFSAEADPERVLDDTSRCDNFAPLGDCAGAAEQSDDRYKLTLLQEGSHISEPSLTNAFEICQMGELESNLILEAHNVGTQAFALTGSDLDVFGYYRLSLTPPANDFTSLVRSGNEAQQLFKIVSLLNPGEEGFVRITLDYTLLGAQFQPDPNDALGKANPAQLRISLNPIGGGTPQDIYLPSQFALSQFYSEVDLWTFPNRAHCFCDDYADIESVSIDPVPAGGLVFHAVSSTNGDRLHVLKVRSGEEKPDPWAAPAGTTIRALAATYDAETISYRAFVAGSNGTVYALDGVDKDEGSFLTPGWTSEAGLVSGPAYLETSADGSMLIVASETGVHVLNALDGAVLRSDTQHAVTTRPVFANTTGTVWYASDETIHGFRSDGSSCSNDTILDQITSNLGINQDETAVFFGTDSGDFFAIGAAGTGSTCPLVDQETALLKRTIVGLDVVSDSGDAVLYVTSSIGEIVRVEYDDGRGFDDEFANGVDENEPREIAAAPVILPTSNGKDAKIVFLTGQTRDGRTDRPILQGWEKDLEEYETVSVWNTSVSFIFKPEENGTIPAELLTPVIDPDTYTLLVASSDGYLYAFDLGQFE